MYKLSVSTVFSILLMLSCPAILCGQTDSSCLSLNPLYQLFSGSDTIRVNENLSLSDTCAHELRMAWSKNAGPLEIYKTDNYFNVHGFVYRFDLNGDLRMIKVVDCKVTVSPQSDIEVIPSRLDVAKFVNAASTFMDLEMAMTYLETQPEFIDKRYDVMISNLLFDLMLLSVSEEAQALEAFQKLKEKLSHVRHVAPIIIESLTDCSIILFDNQKLTGDEASEFVSIE
jgi:hypothetical protein